MKTNRSHYLWLLVAVALCAGWVYGYWSLADQSTHTLPAAALKQDAAMLTQASGQTAQRQGARPAAAHAGHDHHADDLLEALSRQPARAQLFAPQSAHFLPPEMLSRDRFASEQTQLELDPSCEKRLAVPDPQRASQSQLLADYGIDAEPRVPVDLFFESLTQFYRLGAHYYQFSAEARPASRPPRYTLALYRADDEGMQTQVVRQPLAVRSDQELDAPGVRDVLKAHLDAVQNQGAELGARLLEARVTGAQGKEDQELRFLNATPVQWVFGPGVCQLTGERRSLYCRCLPDGEQLRIPPY